MTKSKKHVYHKGDVVRVTNPCFVERVGYPWTKQYVEENIITAEQKKAVDKMLGEFGLGVGTLDVSTWVLDKVRSKIMNELAYGLLHQHNYGGRTRDIYTVYREDWKGRKAKVVGKRMVKTGVYVPGSGGYSFEGEYDYDPPYLKNEMTHVLLQLELLENDDKWFSELCENLTLNEIEEDFVVPFVEEKVLEKVEV